MRAKRIVVSINAAWNVVNFRARLVRGLVAAGYEVIAVAPADEHVGRLRALGIGYVPVAMDKKGVSPVRDLGLLWSYLRILRRLRADVFLGYTAKPNIYGSLAARAVGMKVVNNVSGLGTAFIRGGWLRRVVESLYRLAFRGSSTVFFQNGDDRALFLARKLVRPYQARLLPGSGIDLGHFAPGPPKVPGAPFRFLLVARMLRDKGVMEYVEAARSLRARWPEVRFQLLGPADAENRTAITRAMLDGWAAEGIVDWLGTAADVRPLLAAADCVVLPSYREGLPRTLLEGAAMARPLIATDVPGCRDIVRDGVNGLLCAVADAGALADAMERMLEATPEQRAAWGAASRRIAEAEYSDEIVLARYLEAIEEALQSAER